MHHQKTTASDLPVVRRDSRLWIGPTWDVPRRTAPFRSTPLPYAVPEERPLFSARQLLPLLMAKWPSNEGTAHQQPPLSSLGFSLGGGYMGWWRASDQDIDWQRRRFVQVMALTSYVGPKVNSCTTHRSLMEATCPCTIIVFLIFILMLHIKITGEIILNRKHKR